MRWETQTLRKQFVLGYIITPYFFKLPQRKLLQNHKNIHTQYQSRKITQQPLIHEIIKMITSLAFKKLYL